jgi:hypothetical protein
VFFILMKCDNVSLQSMRSRIMFQKVTVVTVHDGCGRPTIVKMTLAYVYYIGAVHKDGYDVNYNGDAVRPALWIALNS